VNAAATPPLVGTVRAIHHQEAPLSETLSNHARSSVGLIY